MKIQRCLACFCFWFVLMGLSLAPPWGEWTSAKRVVMEIIANTIFIPSAYFPNIISRNDVYGSLTRWVWDKMDPDVLLPQQGDRYYSTLARPPFKVVDSQYDLTADDFRRAEDGTLGIVVKNFTQGKLNKFMTIEGLLEHTGNDTFLFNNQKCPPISDSCERYVPMGFQDGLRKVRDTDGDLYLSFADSFMDKNPIVGSAIDALFNETDAIDDIQILSQKYVKQVFISHGTSSRTAIHTAPVRDWLVQVSGTKRWHFVLPQYSPYLKPELSTYPAFRGARSFVFDGGAIPFTKVFTEPGDLLFFPAHWWHEVHNVQEGLGFAVGLRPVRMQALFKQLASSMVPFLNAPGAQIIRLALFAGMPSLLFSSSLYISETKKDGAEAFKAHLHSLKKNTSELAVSTDRHMDEYHRMRAHARALYVGCEARYRCEL